MLTNSTPNIDTIYKERNRLKQEQTQVQLNIKKTINSTEEQIQKLKNKIDILENKKKTLIIEFNKECDKDDKIRGTTPPQIKRLSSPTSMLSPSTSSSPKSRIIDRRNKDINNINNINNINTQLENDRLMKMIEATMTNKISQLNHKIELQEKERKLEIEKK